MDTKYKMEDICHLSNVKYALYVFTSREINMLIRVYIYIYVCIYITIPLKPYYKEYI